MSAPSLHTKGGLGLTSPERPTSANETAGEVEKRKKKKVPPISIEEIFSQVSTVVASNLNPPPGRVVLTPRSAEVCLKFGVNPEVLKIRDIDSFWEPSIDPAVQRMRHEAYVQRRHELMKQCRQERKRMMNAEFKSSTNINSEAPGLTPEMILEQQKQQSSTLIQLEMQRIAKMQARQEKDLEQMMAYEINRAKINQEMEKRMAEAKKKEELRKKQQEKRYKLMAEERRLRELQKQAVEEAEEETRRLAAMAMHERDRQLAEERARKAIEDKRRMAEEEMEKRRKHEEHKEQLQEYFTQEQLRLRQRLEEMQSAEQKKQDAINQKQQQLAAELRHKRAVVEQRIERNITVAKMVQEKRKQDFLEKQAHFEELRRQHLARQEEERRLHAQEIELQEQRRQMILLMQRKEQEEKAEQMLEKFDDEEVHVQQVFAAKSKELGLVKEKKKLRTMMKLENVDRVMRVNEYRRINTLKKIEETDGRVTKMLEQKQELIKDRKKQSQQARLQKEAIMRVMEELRTNATKASKIIAAGMNGSKITLDALVSAKSSNSRSRSPKSKSNRSKSANALLAGSSQGPPSPDGSYFPGANPNDDSLRGGLYSSSDQIAPKPYVSPYLATEA